MIILILICAALLMGLLFAVWHENEKAKIARDILANSYRKDYDNLRDKLIQTQRELAECQAELAEKKQALDYVCEANRRFAE